MLLSPHVGIEGIQFMACHTSLKSKNTILIENVSETVLKIMWGTKLEVFWTRNGHFENSTKNDQLKWII